MTNLIKIDVKTIAEKSRAAALLPDWIDYMKKELPAVPITLPKLDKLTGGFSGLSVMGGAPGSGKSAIAIQAAEQYAIQGGAVFYLSFEEGRAGIFSKLFQRMTGHSKAEQREYLKRKPEEADRFEKVINEMPNLRVYEMPRINEVFDFQALAKDIEAMQDALNMTALVIVDSLHYTPLPAEYNNLDGKRQIDKCLEIFSSISQETKAAIVLIAHQTKTEAKNKDSDTMSFSGSGKIGYAVDSAFQIVRADDSRNNEREIFVPKNRNGATLTGANVVKVNFNLKYQKLTEA